MHTDTQNHAYTQPYTTIIMVIYSVFRGGKMGLDAIFKRCYALRVPERAG